MCIRVKLSNGKTYLIRITVLAVVSEEILAGWRGQIVIVSIINIAVVGTPDVDCHRLIVIVLDDD